MASHTVCHTAGDAIANCLPFVHAIKREYKQRYCDYCVSFNEGLKKCSKCRQMFYCGTGCQRNDWRSHKLECDAYKLYHYNDLDIPDELLVRMILRLVFMIKGDSNVLTTKHVVHRGVQMCFNDLVNRENQIKADIEWRAKGLQLMRDCIDRIALDVSDELLSQLLGRIVANMTEIRVNDTLKFMDQRSGRLQNVISVQTSQIGFGIYLPIAVFRHSCRPNAAYMSYGHRVVLRALRTIAADEQVLISYVSPEMTKRERHYLLRRNHFIEACDCVRCASGMDSQVDYDRLRSLEDTFIDNSTDEGVVTIQAGDQPRKRDLNEAIKVGAEILAILRQIYPDYHPNLSAKMFIQAMSLWQAVSDPNCAETLESVKPFIIETFANLSITHGANHELFLCFAKNVANRFGLNF